VDFSEVDLETELVDLSDVSLATLRECDAELTAQSLRRVVSQVERPRANIGSGGPPGRVD
jgi:FXSXX-COOH protein